MNIFPQFCLKLINCMLCFGNYKLFYLCILLTIYKAFIRPHLDYSDAIYDKILDEILIKYESWHKKLKSAQ